MCLRKGAEVPRRLEEMQGAGQCPGPGCEFRAGSQWGKWKLDNNRKRGVMAPRGLCLLEDPGPNVAS